MYLVPLEVPKCRASIHYHGRKEAGPTESACGFSTILFSYPPVGFEPPWSMTSLVAQLCERLRAPCVSVRGGRSDDREADRRWSARFKDIACVSSWYLVRSVSMGLPRGIVVRCLHRVGEDIMYAIVVPSKQSIPQSSHASNKPSFHPQRHRSWRA